MDFTQILAEYKGATGKQKKKGPTWWKDEKWNKAPQRRENTSLRSYRHVEKSFCKIDHILSLSGKWESCFQWLLQNQCLAAAPVCTVCNYEMELSNHGQGMKRDMRMWRCKSCLTRESVRHRSFMIDCNSSMQMFMRCVFYYFLKQYEPELAYREMTENMSDGLGCQVSKSAICSQYALARERISRYMISSVRTKKLGGINNEVMVDFMKLHVRAKKGGKNEEHIVLGFIEEGSNRSRAYLVPNNKQQTIVQYLSKTVARGSILYTPFYQESGWEFLDKYYTHKRLLTQKGEKYDYNLEKEAWHKRTGFDKMWRHCRALEMSYLKFQQNIRRYGQVHENLQMFIDEAVWRAEHASLPAKREALCLAFGVDLWDEEQKESKLGVGGGYGQFGILTEEEFNTLIKLDGKRIQKFTEHPDQFKQAFNQNRYPVKDNGIRIVTGPKDMREDCPSSSVPDQEEDEEVFAKPTYKFGYRRKNNLPDENAIDIVEVAKRRFDFRHDDEAKKNAMPSERVGLTQEVAQITQDQSRMRRDHEEAGAKHIEQLMRQMNQDGSQDDGEEDQYDQSAQKQQMGGIRDVMNQSPML